MIFENVNNYLITSYIHIYLFTYLFHQISVETQEHDSEVPAMANGGCLPSVIRGVKWGLCVRKFCSSEVTQSKTYI